MRRYRRRQTQSGGIQGQWVSQGGLGGDNTVDHQIYLVCTDEERVLCKGFRSFLVGQAAWGLHRKPQISICHLVRHNLEIIKLKTMYPGRVLL